VIKSKLYQRLFRPEWQLRKDVDSKSYFANTMQGSRKTYYITSSHKTGWRGNYAVIDDSLSAENRFNAAVKESVFDSWENVISTRVNRSQHHAYVIIMQRLAYDDLVGRLIDKYGDRYVQLILSNEYEPEYHCKTPIFSDPRTIPGELLAPDFFPAERTEESKFSLRDEYVGQFLQRPMPLGGLKFESQYFQHWRWSPHNKVIELMHRDGRLEHINLNKCEQFISIDLAVGTKKKNDSTSMGRWALTHDCNLILLERIKIQAKEGEVVDAAKNFYNDKKWGTNSPSSVAVEDNGLGLPVAQHMAAEGLPVNYINVHQDKETMASSASIRLRGGQIFFPEYCVPWMHEFSLELTRFPGAAHDDDVSMVSIASNSVFEMKHGIKGAAQSFPNNIPRYNINKQASLPARRDLFGTNGH
jgi:predicted phage terminase large subunit-like protein